MGWFQKITGFRDAGYDSTRQRLAVAGKDLISHVNGSRHRIGRFEPASLSELSAHGGQVAMAGPRSTVRCQIGDSRAMHSDPSHRLATFQVASQLNALEMVVPDVTPEHGVTRYINDRTQGLACAIAAGATTIWRNYFVPLGHGHGQTAHRQVDTLASLGQALSQRLDCPIEELWSMRNGYALTTDHGLQQIGQLLLGLLEVVLDALRGDLG